MKRITLLCAAGMSTGALVTKMRQAAEEQGYEADIHAYPMSQAEEVAADSDVILLGPQVSYNLGNIRGLFPNKPVDAIPMMMYGMQDGKGSLEFARKLMGEL